MNPANFFREEPRRVINGPRPSPLRINKDSHVIQKPSSVNKVTKQQKVTRWNNHQQPRQPVIIYTHSPKIIHTKPKDFMALVQKLTGFTRSEDELVRDESQRGDRTTYFEEKNSDKAVSHEDNDSSSVTSDDKYEDDKYEGDNDSNVIKDSSSAASPINKGLNPYSTDIPLFTPNSNNLFPSSQPVFRYPDVVFTPPNVVGSLSPSFLEFIKCLPEY